MSPLWVPLVSGVLAFIGSVLGTIVTFRLNEKTRRLELYKTIYPEKFRQTKLLMEAASRFYNAISFWSDYSGFHSEFEARKTELWNAAKELSDLSITSEWILGEDIRNLSGKLGGIGMAFLHLKEHRPDDMPVVPSEEYKSLYDTLCKTVKQQLHMHEFETVFPQLPKP